MSSFGPQPIGVAAVITQRGTAARWATCCQRTGESISTTRRAASSAEEKKRDLIPFLWKMKIEKSYFLSYAPAHISQSNFMSGVSSFIDISFWNLNPTSVWSMSPGILDKYEVSFCKLSLQLHANLHMKINSCNIANWSNIRTMIIQPFFCLIHKFFVRFVRIVGFDRRQISQSEAEL